MSSYAKVGFDLELNNARRDLVAISQLVFDSEEHYCLLAQPSTSSASFFYELWCSREALYKLRPAGQSAPLVSADGTIRNSGCGWYRYSLPRNGITIVVCSDRNLSEINQVELQGLSREDWMEPGQMKI